MTGLCKDCRYFIEQKSGRGECDRWLTGYGVSERDVPLNGCLVEYDEGWGMVVGPEFGCVLHEQKD